jgi:cytochrome c
MWNLNTNNIIAAVIAAVWLLVGSNYIGNLLIPPFEPIHEAKASTGGATAPVAKKAVVPDQPLPVLLASANADKGKKVAKKCVSCHSFDKGGKNKVGPNLYNIMGKDRAASSGFNYSDAIKKMGGKWGFDDMNKFLIKPKTFMPGTKMAFNGLKKAGDRAAVILYLRNFADAPLALPK